MDIIQIDKVSKYFLKDNKKFYANDNISFGINNGDIIGFLGKNGAGKTTLIKIICNLILPDSGQVLIEDESITKNPKIIHRDVGVVLEGARNLYNFLTVDYNIKYFSYLNKLNDKNLNSRINKLLSLFELEDKRNEVVNNLSRGMQQKVAIIIAMLKDPRILILDEPTLGLDIVSKVKMKNLLKELRDNYGKTIVISSHDLDIIETVCDKVAIFDKGKLTNYAHISDLKFNSIEDIFEITLSSCSKNILSNYSYKHEDGVIKLEVKDLNELLGKIDMENIIKIEKKSTNIEEYLK